MPFAATPGTLGPLVAAATEQGRRKFITSAKTVGLAFHERAPDVARCVQNAMANLTGQQLKIAVAEMGGTELSALLVLGSAGKSGLVGSEAPVESSTGNVVFVVNS